MALIYLEDFYYDQNGNMVFTERYHLKRGTCCGSDCLHCPFDGIKELDLDGTGAGAEIRCPFCNEKFQIPIYIDDGKSQSFVYDCEICCRPINLIASYDDAGVLKLVVNRT